MTGSYTISTVKETTQQRTDIDDSVVNNNKSDMGTSQRNNNDNNKEEQLQQRDKALRIVSLLPSITEILAAIGVGEQIVGITHECDYPEWVVHQSDKTNMVKVVTTSEINPRTLTQSEIHTAVIGSLAQGHSLYGLNHDTLRSIQPIDFIFTQSLCDVCAVSYPIVLDTCARILAGPLPSSCSVNMITGNTTGSNNNNKKDSSDSSTNNNSHNNISREPQVISMEPNNLMDVLKTFHVAARALDGNDDSNTAIQERENIVVHELELGFEIIRQAVANKSRRPTVAFMEWRTPIFSGGHWIPDMIHIAGGDYQMCRSGDRSAAWTDDDFTRLDPDVILIGPCGFSLDRTVQDTISLLYQDPKRALWWKQLRAVQMGRVYALDGNSYYARPGPRLLQGCGIMAKCIHDDNSSRDNMVDVSQELAPSSGYCRITPDMTDQKE